MQTRTLPNPIARRSAPLGRAVHLLVAAGLLAGVLAVGSVVGAPAAGAQTCGNIDATPTLTVTPNVLSASATTTVTVTGTDYLVPQYQCGKSVFGGIYVFVGWVAPGGQWGPSWRSSTSSNGQFGVTYSYPGEGGGGETRDDGSGVVRLVSFTPGGMSGEETPFHMDPAGNWTTTINVRGALYSWTDISTGASNVVDCRVVQCGILTIGAHGKSSRTNELFTPITFRDDGPPPTVAPGGVSAAPPSSAGGGATAAPGGTGSKAAPGKGAATAGAVGGDAGTAPAAGEETTTTSEAAAAATTTPGAATSEAAVEDEDEERRVVAGEAAGVQDFGDGSGTAGLVIGLVALVLVVAGATITGWFVRHRRAASAEGS
jgi:hypothetical protein